jgi:hypothetical protein
MIKTDNLWSIIKRITIVVSIIINSIVIIVFLIILTHTISINVNENGVATVSKDVPLTMPITFDMGAIKIKGDADVVIPKETVLPVKIRMNIPLLEAIRIKNKVETETKNVKDAKETDSTNDKDKKQPDPTNDKDKKQSDSKKVK